MEFFQEHYAVVSHYKGNFPVDRPILLETRYNQLYKSKTHFALPHFIKNEEMITIFAINHFVSFFNLHVKWNVAIEIQFWNQSTCKQTANMYNYKAQMKVIGRGYVLLCCFLEIFFFMKMRCFFGRICKFIYFISYFFSISVRLSIV